VKYFWPQACFLVPENPKLSLIVDGHSKLGLFRCCSAVPNVSSDFELTLARQYYGVEKASHGTTVNSFCATVVSN